MHEWHRILNKVLTRGTERDDRTGVGTLALFGEQLVFDNSNGTFPAVTTKRLAFSQVCSELACFLKGYDNLADFHKENCHIWDANGNAPYWKPRARFEGDLGRIYGVQWRSWTSPRYDSTGDTLEVDQIRALVDSMSTDPHGRRHIVSAWNSGEFDKACLPPCHILFQAYVVNGQVDLRVDMRSVDLFLGLPFDIASYAVLQKLLAKELSLKSGRLIFQLGDAHIYKNHIDQVKLVLTRTPLGPPSILIGHEATIFNFSHHDAMLADYNHHGTVSAPMNV